MRRDRHRPSRRRATFGYVNPHHLYRDTERGRIAGVCAGIADYYNTSPSVVRILAIILTVFFTIFAVGAYCIMAIVIQPKPDASGPVDDTFWREFSNQPRNTFGAVRHRLRELEHRLRRLEAHVTSKEFQMDRELKR